MILPRNLVIAEANSKLTVVESYISTGNVAYFTNAVTEILAGDNAAVEHIKLQDEAADAFHIATIAGEFGRASNVTVHSFALGAKISRTNIRAKLAGEGLECILNGLYLTRGEQLADHHMIVEHAQPHCASHEYFNGILDDKSKGVFHGRIYVHPIAQKTDAKQTNKNLLLSDDATADTKPQLEIYADDVKCTHGATIGQLNDESIFYLRSRGIGTDMARQMLIHAFAGEIIERMKCAPAREELTSWCGTGSKQIRICSENEIQARDARNCRKRFSCSHARPVLNYVCSTTSTTFISRSSLTTASSRAISTRCRRRPARRKGAIRSAATS